MKTVLAQAPCSITPLDLERLLVRGGGCEILDVRTPPEHAGAHLEGVKLLPLDDLDPTAYVRQRPDPNAPLYVICQSGGRAAKAIEKFRAAGFDQCVLVEGGTQGWIDAGLPVIRGTSKVLPLMRQVQIVVGFVSAIGSALALTVDARFAILPLLTGCGLLFAGLTGLCGLAILLAKMPWNRGDQSAAAAPSN